MVPLLITFLKLSSRHDNIVWVYGNHDVCFFKKYIFNVPTSISIYDYEQDSIIHHKNFNYLKQLLKLHIILNEYPCIYYDGKICVSHTLISKIDDPIRDLNSLNLFYTTFHNIIDKIYAYNYCNIDINEILKEPPRLSIFDDCIDLLDKCIDIISKIDFKKTMHDFDDLEIDDQIKFINRLAKIADILNPFEFSNDINQSLYWLRPFNYEECKGLKEGEYYIPSTNTKYFIGHTPFSIIDEVDKIDIIDNITNDITNDNINITNDITNDKINITNDITDNITNDITNDKINITDDITNDKINITDNKIDKLHKEILYTIKNNNDYNYNKDIAILSYKCYYISDFLSLTREKYLKTLNNDKYNQSETFNNNVYFTDIGATHGLMMNKKGLFGNYLCGFAIVDNKNNVRSSKIYVF